MQNSEIIPALLKEAAYHRKVRIRAIKRGDTIVDGIILETKSKYPINTFENGK